MNNPVLIIGPDIETRGVGGVTIHVKRLREYLELNGIDYVFKDSRGNSFSSLLKAMKGSAIVHLNLSNPVLQFVLVLFGRIMEKKVIMTLHGNYGRFGWLKNQMVKISIKVATIPIVINEKSYEACKKYNKHLQLIPAFIPPQKEECLAKEIVDLLDELHRKGRKLVSTNASNVAFDKDGNDIYGIDFLVQYFKESREMALVVSDPSGNYHKQYKELQSESVFFIDYPHPYFEVLKHADFFVRNTSTDGDALSVKEALWLGVLSLCTDVVDRPEGALLFKYCDKDSFEQSLKLDKHQEVTIENGAEKIVQVYKEIER